MYFDLFSQQRHDDTVFHRLSYRHVTSEPSHDMSMDMIGHAKHGIGVVGADAVD